MGKKSQAKKRRNKRRKNLRGELQALYNRLPQIQCKGLCHHSCGPIPLFTAEIAPLVAASHLNLRRQLIPLPSRKGHWLLSPLEGKTSCPLLRNNRCTAYEQRPYICRTYGTAEGLECPHGCTVERMLSKQEVGQLIKELEELSLLLD